ncbi:MAG: RibD family protein [Minicystis sp.]
MIGKPPAPRSRVTLHFAQSLDGRIATHSGSARWISGPPATRFAHSLRAQTGAVIIGSGTAITDDPLLTVRLVPGRHPLRVVLDARARLPPTLRLFHDRDAPTLHVTCAEPSPTDTPHVERWRLPAGPTGEGVDLEVLLTRLAARGIDEVLVEGGHQILTAFLRAHLVDRMIITIAPIIVGAGIDAVGELEIERIDQALHFTTTRVYTLGEDVMIELVPRADPAANPGPA